MDKISATATDLMEQSSETAGSYFRSAIKTIDSKFGDGYAKEHPELISSFMNTCALDFGASVITSALQDISESILERFGD